MDRITTSREMPTGLGLVLGLTSVTLAGPPRILDQIPAEAPFVVAIPSLDELSNDMQTMLRAAEFPMAGMVDAEQMLMMQGMGGMIDTDKPVALFIPSLPEGDSEPIMIGLAPCPDVQKVVEMAEGEDLGGVFLIEADGEDMYLRPIGDGYAVFSDDMGSVKDFQLGAGQMQAHLANAGKAGEDLIADSSMVIMTNIGVMGPWMDELKEMVGDNMGVMPGAEGFDVDAMGDNALASWLEDHVIRDGEYLVAGLIPSTNGLSIQASMRFKPDSMMAKAFGAKSDSSRMMKSVPNQPFIMAYGFDAKAEPVQAALKGFVDAAKDAQDDLGGGGMDFFNNVPMEGITGQAMVLGMSPGIMFGGGLFSNTVFYTETDNPTATMASIREAVEDIDGASEGGMEMESTYEAGKTTIGGVSTDAWAIKMTPDGTDPMAMQTTGMIFGPSMGPDGYLAATESGVVQTFAKNSILMQAAIDASKGQGATLASADPMVAAVGEQLPANRVVEFYLGVGPIAEAAGPMLAGFMGIQLDLPPNIPPVAMGIGSQDGVAHVTIFVPTPVIKVAGSLAGAVMMDGGF